MDFKYPYTDFHELNLDWFMARFKELVEEWNSVKEDWNSLHDYVQNYFDNLNVQTEINNKINAMIADGSFATIVTPLVEAALPTIVYGKLPAVVASQIGAVVAAQIDAVVAGQLPAVAAQAAADEVGTWLVAHINPDTGYVIDDTLTVQNAAADAKTVGNNLTSLFNMINYIHGYYTGAMIIDGGYITTSGETVDINIVTSNTAWCYCILDVSAGDIITVSGEGGGNPRLWAFIDNQGNTLSAAAANATADFNILTAPADSAKFIYNSRIAVNHGLCVGNTSLKDIKDLENLQNDFLFERNGGIIVDASILLQGTYNLGQFSYDTTRICTVKIPAYRGMKINFTPGIIAAEMNVITWTGGSYSSTGYQNAPFDFVVSNQDYIAIVFRKTVTSDNIEPNDYDADTEIMSFIQSEISNNHIIVASYNEGDFSGAGYTQGSDELALLYRRAVGDLNADIVFFQDDVKYFNGNDQTLPKTEVFGMFKNYFINEGGSLNYIGWASDYPLYGTSNVIMTSYYAHPRFYLAKVNIRGTEINLINLHLDWYDKTMRQSQIQQVIDYIDNNNLKKVIIAGDMNPSTRENGQFPAGSSHTHNYSNIQEDYAIWTAAGFTVCNAGYFGDYQTDMTYSDADDGGAMAAWDNIIVTPDIQLKNVGNLIKPYMNDHAPFWAELII